MSMTMYLVCMHQIQCGLLIREQFKQCLEVFHALLTLFRLHKIENGEIPNTKRRAFFWFCMKPQYGFVWLCTKCLILQLRIVRYLYAFASKHNVRRCKQQWATYTQVLI